MRAFVYTAGAVLVAGTLIAGCAEEFEAGGPPVTTPTGSGGDAATGGSAGGDVGGQGGDGAQGGSGGQGGQGGSTGECATPADCEELIGVSPCGQWACDAGTCRASATGCTDADADGYGVGVDCVCGGIDCDDNDEDLQANGVRDCYSGPDGTEGVGICHAGTEICADGVLGPCAGELGPSGETCNNEDDDCNGFTDDELPERTCGIGACEVSVPSCQDGQLALCTPGAGTDEGQGCDGIDNDCDGAIDENCSDCMHVVLNSTTMAPDGTPAAPYASIQEAIDAAFDAGKDVCVSSGPDCSVGTFDLASTGTPLTMKDGVSVIGSFNSNGWVKCNPSTNADGLNTLSTQITVGTAEGILFPSTVTSPTMLEGFAINRDDATTRAGITVDGATGVIISHVRIAGGPQVTNSYGIDLLNGAEATISNVYVTGGPATAESIAIRSIGSRPTLLDVCRTIDAQGRCTAGCGGYPGLRGGEEGTFAAEAFAVLLEDSPGALLNQIYVCGTFGTNTAGVKIEGDATGTVVRSSDVEAWGGGADNGQGLLLEDCADAAPWIVDNHRIAVEGQHDTSLVDGIRAVGACHPLIDSNATILGGMEGGAAESNGIYCGADASLVASRCVVVGNTAIRGSNSGLPPLAAGVRCADDACARIAHNELITGSQAAETYGIWLGATGVLVDDNRVEGGCGPISVGLRAEDSWSRIQNNVLTGNLCPNAGSAVTTSRGASIILAATPNGVDMHSNTLLGGGTSIALCESSALSLGENGAPGAGRGSFRNNIFHAGECGTTRYGVQELDADADPALFDNNNCDPFPLPTALYLDEATTLLSTALEVNALTDMLVASTISASSQFVLYPANLHLAAGSACIGAGTAEGAPLVDFDGEARDVTTPDIGADEAQ